MRAQVEQSCRKWMLVNALRNSSWIELHQQFKFIGGQRVKCENRYNVLSPLFILQAEQTVFFSLSLFLSIIPYSVVKAATTVAIITTAVVVSASTRDAATAVLT